jgi:hypothetical protein
LRDCRKKREKDRKKMRFLSSSHFQLSFSRSGLAVYLDVVVGLVFASCCSTIIKLVYCLADSYIVAIIVVIVVVVMVMMSVGVRKCLLLW